MSLMSKTIASSMKILKKKKLFPSNKRRFRTRQFEFLEAACLTKL
jgi:hypothetical protein